MPLIIFIVTTVVPIALWLWFVRWEDRSEPEPGRLMRRCFYTAIFACLGAGLLEVFLFELLRLPAEPAELAHTSPYLALLTVFLVGPIEEVSKYIVLRTTVYASHDFNQVFDGIVYGITVALGFSFVENILYFMDFYTSEPTLPFIIFASLRGLLSTLGHVTFTGIMGYFLGVAKFSNLNRGWIITKGVLIASVVHAVFDFLLLGHIPYGGLFCIGAIVSCFIVFVRLWATPEVRMVWEYTPPEVLSTKV